MTTSNNEEHERTSLLASTSAPPDESRPRPTLSHPYNPGNPPSERRQQPQPTIADNNNDYSKSRRETLTNTSLEEMERAATRLTGDIGDSDSVNGLLAGMEASDDEASNFGDAHVGDEDGPVTHRDLEFLTSSAAARRASNGAGGGKDQANDGADSRMAAERVTNELLSARGNPRLEEKIMRRSLKLAPLPKGALSAPPEDDDDHDDDERVSERVHRSTRALRASVVASGGKMRRVPSAGGIPPEIEPGEKDGAAEDDDEGGTRRRRRPALTIQVMSMVALTLFVMLLLAGALALGTLAVGPPRQPLGEYKIVEAQVGQDFWGYYNFYAGKDSVGSNGYITYLSKENAAREGITEVVTEAVPKESMIEVYEEGDARAGEDWLAEDLAFLDQLRREEEEEESAETSADGDSEDEEDGTGDDGADNSSSSGLTKKTESNRRLQEVTSSDAQPPKLEPFNPDLDSPANGTNPTETFVRISSSPTPEGPRNSVRLEGRRQFNRGLFIIDLRHMPAGCGTWPAFWLTDEANWPVNGEIDIVEGVNYQDTAKTALHSTKTCQMDDVPEGTKTGSWDTAVGIPNKKTGIPDMTFRYAQNCFVYDPHQWINQGCVATDLKLEGRSLGMPLNANGGGVYALEWDPVNTHIRSWVFSPHGRVPRNLREALRTAQEEDVGKRVAPDTNLWGLPYGHFPIGEGTNCPAGHFRNMRLVINLAFCGSVSGNRYFMDCPEKFKKFKTCNEYVKSDPEELKEAYWKIRGVYVYEREWERRWT